MVQCNTMGTQWEYSRYSMGMAREYQRNLGSNIRILLGITWEEHGNTAGILYRYYGNTVAGNTMGTAWKDRGNVMGIL